MRFPKHWRIVHQGNVSAWGWSDESPAHAEIHAATRLDRIVEWLKRGGQKLVQRYGYPDRPMREPVLREFRDPEGTLVAAVTRNSYGCLVLNTARLMFVDVDAPAAKTSSFLAGLFGFRRPTKTPVPDFEPGVRRDVDQWLARHPDWGWRLYRTRAGMRLMATQAAIQSDDPVCAEAFESFFADPLYRRLCGSQKCFRARLTPKPWRCGMAKPGSRWPWRDAQAERAFAAWERRYTAVAERFATCEFIGHFGRTEAHPELQPLIELHDAAARATSKLPLA